MTESLGQNELGSTRQLKEKKREKESEKTLLQRIFRHMKLGRSSVQRIRGLLWGLTYKELQRLLKILSTKPHTTVQELIAIINEIKGE